MSTLHLTPAVKGKKHHDYEITTVASIDLAELVPTLVLPCILGDNFPVKADGELLLAPQSFPAFGKGYLKSAAFFVPEHQIIEQASAFHENMSIDRGKNVVMPHIKAMSILTMFQSFSSESPNQLCSVVQVVEDPSDFNVKYHFIVPYYSSGSAVVKFRACLLTSLGKKFYKILKGLGFDFPSPFYAPGASYGDVIAPMEEDLNILPLLAYAKIYVDMFLNGNLYNNSLLVDTLHKIRNCEDVVQNDVTIYDSSTGLATWQVLYECIDSCVVPHEGNLYNEAWNYPNSPAGYTNIGSASPKGLVSPYEFNREENATGVSANFIQHNPSADFDKLSANGLRLLKAFDTFVRRFHLSGTKAVQKVYATFGLKPDDFNSHYVHKIYEHAERIKFRPVMSNTANGSAAEGKALGSYAGASIGSFMFDFQHSCNDRGYIICLNWIQIVPMLVRGFNPMVLRMHAFDFYSAQFDGKASRPIPYCEIGVDDNTSLFANATDTSVYGYTGLYDDYRKLRDVILGDFVLDENTKNFVLARDLSVLRKLNPTGIKPQDADVHYFNRNGNPDMTDPFQYDETVGDRFYIQIDWQINAQRDLLTSSEAVDLGPEGDVEVPKNGNMMS